MGWGDQGRGEGGKGDEERMKAESLQGRKEREDPGRGDWNKSSEKGKSGQGGNGGQTGEPETP